MAPDDSVSSLGILGSSDYGSRPSHADPLLFRAGECFPTPGVHRHRASDQAPALSTVLGALGVNARAVVAAWKRRGEDPPPPQ